VYPVPSIEASLKSDRRRKDRAQTDFDDPEHNDERVSRYHEHATNYDIRAMICEDKMAISFTLTINRPYGSIRIEDNSLPKLVTDLVAISKDLRRVDSVIQNSQATPNSSSYEHVLGSFPSSPVLPPHVRRKVSDKELIGILLFVQDPHACTPSELHRAMRQNEHPSKGYSARLSEMKSKGLIFKDGSGYRLSYTGKNWMKAVSRKLL
jgi:hypothetical protein